MATCVHMHTDANRHACCSIKDCSQRIGRHVQMLQQNRCRLDPDQTLLQTQSLKQINERTMPDLKSRQMMQRRMHVCNAISRRENPSQQRQLQQSWRQSSNAISGYIQLSNSTPTSNTTVYSPYAPAVRSGQTHIRVYCPSFDVPECTHEHGA
jgi:hypothetical protein